MTPTTDLQRPIIKTELPGPRGREIIAEDAKYVTPSYPRPDYKLVAEKGYGVWIEDADGNVFLDCNAGVAVCSTGHCHPEIVEAITEQTRTLMHMCGTDFYYQHMPESRQKVERNLPDQRRYENAFCKFRRGSGRNRFEIGDVSHKTPEIYFVFWIVSRQNARRTFADIFKTRTAAWVCAAGFGRCSRSVSK